PGIGIKEVGGAKKTLTESMGEVLMDCQSIKPGMHRSHLLKLFTTEGGISASASHRAFVHRNCPYVKIDVDLNPAHVKQGKFEENPGDTIAGVSEPHLGWSIAD